MLVRILKSELCEVKKFEDLAVTLGYYPKALTAAKCYDSASVRLRAKGKRSVLTAGIQVGKTVALPCLGSCFISGQ